MRAAICTCKLSIKLLVKLGLSLGLQAGRALVFCPIYGMTELQGNYSQKGPQEVVEHNLLLKAKCVSSGEAPPGLQRWCWRKGPASAYPVYPVTCFVSRAVLYRHISIMKNSIFADDFLQTPTLISS